MVFVLSACSLDNVDLPSLMGGGGSTTVTDIGPAPEIPSDSNFQVHYIDVGQADAALVICDGETMLIDGGNRADSDLMYSYLEQHSITHLNYVIGTHGHEDHIGGISGALQYASVDTVFCSVNDYDSRAFENFVNAAHERDASVEVPEAGYTFNLGSAVCQIVGPVREFEDPNDTSIVLRVVYGETTFLFTGDAETPAETSILEAGYTIDCDVLKVGHHGASTSTGYRWLREASPKCAVISVGADNDYGHPTEATLSKLRDADVTTYRTDMHGTIVCLSDGRDVTFLTSRNPSGSPLDGAGEGGSHGGISQPSNDKNASEGHQNGSNAATEYVININSGKFHCPDCESVAKISDKNKKEITATRDEMFAEGYSPCGYCDP
jgi:competence protein ComEC